MMLDASIEELAFKDQLVASEDDVLTVIVGDVLFREGNCSETYRRKKQVANRSPLMEFKESCLESCRVKEFVVTEPAK